MRAITWLKGLAMGAGVMYYFDPERGRKRRAMLKDQAVHFGNVKKSSLNVMQKDFANRAKGLVHTVQSKVQNDHPDGSVLEQRVRSAMGRFTSHASSVNVECVGGDVTLSGPVLATEVQDLVKCVQNVKGVSHVYNNLDVYDHSEGISGLQGGATRPVNTRLTPAECLISVSAGTILTLYGIGKRGPLGWIAGLAGAGLIAKGFSDTEHRFDPGTAKSTSTNGHRTMVQDSIAEFGGSGSGTGSVNSSEDDLTEGQSGSGGLDLSKGNNG